MQQNDLPASPQTWARVGGVLYLAIIVIGIFGEAFVRGGLVVAGDANATAEKILASQSLWRVGIAAELVLLCCAVALALVFYVLLKPVSRHLALLATLFGMLSIATEAASTLNLFATLFPLADASYLQVIDPNQLHVLAYLSIRMFEHGFGASLIFFACDCLILGPLIFRSGYLPRTIGVLMQVAGVSYLINSFALILAPAFASQLFPYILLPALIGEGSLCLWLLFKGVNVTKWNARTGAASPALT